MIGKRWFALTATSASKMWIVRYTYVPNILERRQPFRGDHLAHAQHSKQKGELLMGGAFANPTDGAALIFQAESIDKIKEFIQRDPYVINGLVTEHEIREWTVVI